MNLHKLRNSVSMLFFLFTGYLDLKKYVIKDENFFILTHHSKKKKRLNLLYINDHQILQELITNKKLPRTLEISLSVYLLYA